MATSSSRKDTAWDARFDRVFHELVELTHRALSANWDGYGAEAVRDDAVDEARAVLEVLPTEIPLPEPSIEPDGSIGLEWHARPGWTYVLTLSGRGEIEYAGIFGENETHGREHFRGALPHLIAEHLRRLVPAK